MRVEDVRLNEEALSWIPWKVEKVMMTPSTTLGSFPPVLPCRRYRMSPWSDLFLTHSSVLETDRLDPSLGQEEASQQGKFFPTQCLWQPLG